MYRQHYPNDPGMHNMPEAYTRSPPQRSVLSFFFEKVYESLVAILVGLLILGLASGLVFWNEGRAVQTAKSLEEGLRAVRSLKTPEVIFDENNEKLIHITGALRTNKALYDEDYSIAVPAVKLRRNVEMYQWVEDENRREIHDGDTVREEVSYSYSQQWRSDLIRSNSFNNRLHVNPEKIPVMAKIYVADDVQVGSFQLSQSLVEKVTNFHELHPNDPPKDPHTKLFQGHFYHGFDPLQPQIGDVRVIFEYAGLSGKDTSRLGSPDKVSILARQSHSELLPYMTEAGDVIEMLYQGEHTAEFIIGREHLSNTMLLWALRFVGWLLMFIGFGCLTSFLVTIVEWFPVLRELVMLGTMTFSVVMSISLSLTVIALGWIWYRPYLGLLILAIAVLPFVIARVRSRHQPPPRTYRPL